MLKNFIDENKWNNWEALEGELTSGPNAVCCNNRINVIVKGTDNGLRYRMWDGNA